MSQLEIIYLECTFCQGEKTHYHGCASRHTPLRAELERPKMTVKTVIKGGRVYENEYQEEAMQFANASLLGFDAVREIVMSAVTQKFRWSYQDQDDHLEPSSGRENQSKASEPAVVPQSVGQLPNPEFRQSMMTQTQQNLAALADSHLESAPTTSGLIQSNQMQLPIASIDDMTRKTSQIRLHQAAPSFSSSQTNTPSSAARVSSTPLNPLAPPFQPVSQAQTDQSFISELSRSLQETIASMNDPTKQVNKSILNQIKIYNGEPDEFLTWRLSIEAAKEIVPEKSLFVKLMASLGQYPTQYLKTRPAVMTVDQALRTLGQRYDPLGNPMRATAYFNTLRQGTLSLDEYNQKINSCMHSMGKTSDSTEPLLVMTYVKSLADPSTRKSIYRKMQDRPDGMTIKEVMDHARTGHIANETDIAFEKDFQEQVEAVNAFQQGSQNQNRGAYNRNSGGSGRFQQGRPRFKRPFKQGNNSGNDYCVIHERKTHSTKDCNSVNRTECPYCKVKVKQGELPKHMPDCKGKRCRICDFRGHLQRSCTARTHRNGTPLTKRQKVNVANEENDADDEQSDSVAVSSQD